MVRRGWDFNSLMGMSAGEFNHWLQTAIEAAEREKAAMDRLSPER